MSDKNDKFIIPKLQGEDNTSIITTRMPNKLVKKIEDICADTNRSRTQVIIMALEFALDRLEIIDSREQ